VGGTKTPDLVAILELEPDLVIANQEENRRVHVEKLRAVGLQVWVTYPRSVREGARVLGELAALGASRADARRVLGPVEAALESVACRPPRVRTRVFCPIWRDPWMAVGGDTYADDLLTLCGGRNVFSSRPERRYPVVGLEEIERATRMRTTCSRCAEAATSSPRGPIDDPAIERLVGLLQDGAED
jgi:ABC-type Fe3+-hydroxamate transport system substrate-binding protein